MKYDIVLFLGKKQDSKKSTYLQYLDIYLDFCWFAKDKSQLVFLGP